MNPERRWRLIGLGFGLASTGVSLMLVASFPLFFRWMATALAMGGLLAILIGYLAP